MSDWFDMITALLDTEARFLVAGAHATAVHGVPRGTQDLDLWIEPTEENAERVWRALENFGAPAQAISLTRADLLRPGTVIQFGLPPSLPDFDEAWAERREHTVRSTDVPFLGRRSLVANKRATGRTKDLADLEAFGGVGASSATRFSA